MRFNKIRLLLIAALTICVQSNVPSQNATDQLQRLMETSAQRLAIAEQVALAKWDSGAPVEDPSREAKVIASAVKAGERLGLDQASVSNFFRAQIEANKLVQHTLLASWRRLGKAPDHSPVNLDSTIRPRLDLLETEMVTELANTAGIRASASCRIDIAKAVGKYVSAHVKSFDPLKAIALDRAVAAACT